MDIEGSEFEWINNLTDIEMNKLKQICIEFHLEHECSNSISLKSKLETIKKLATTHYCVHFHRNNWRSTTLFGEKIINIGISDTKTKIINLEKEYSSDTKLVFDYKSQFPIKFSYTFDKNELIITRIDQNSGWEFEYKCVINGLQIPKVFECTYIHKSLVNKLPLNTRVIPNALLNPNEEDFENNRKPNRHVPDIFLESYPFVDSTVTKDVTLELCNCNITIPKIIHQTYKNHTLPEIYQMCQTELKRLHPDFEYRFYTDNDMDDLIKTEFPEYYERFAELPRMIMKIDMFRYFLMYKYGGLYADMDYLMFKPFDLFNKTVVIPTNRDKVDNRLCSLGNCIFASVPNHLFWKSLIDTLFDMDRKNLPFDGFDNVINNTGPMFVFEMYNKYSNKEDIHVPERMLFHPPSKKDSHYIEQLKKQGYYGMHICTGSWLNDKL